MIDAIRFSDRPSMAPRCFRPCAYKRPRQVHLPQLPVTGPARHGHSHMPAGPGQPERRAGVLEPALHHVPNTEARARFQPLNPRKETGHLQALHSCQEQALLCGKSGSVPCRREPPQSGPAGHAGRLYGRPMPTRAEMRGHRRSLCCWRASCAGSGESRSRARRTGARDAQCRHQARLDSACRH